MSESKQVYPNMTFTSPNGGRTVEVFILPPKSHFSPFGGSKSGLLVGKTPSIVTRDRDGSGTLDTEWDVHSPRVWEWFHRMQAVGFTVSIHKTQE
jgi:hypothetical protein